MADHQNPSSEMGQTRRNGAELMSNMHTPSYGKIKEVVTKKTIEDMNREFDRKRKAGQNKPEVKERITRKTVKKAKDQNAVDEKQRHNIL